MNSKHRETSVMKLDQGSEISRLITPNSSHLYEDAAKNVNNSRPVTKLSKQLLRTVSLSDRQIETKLKKSKNTFWLLTLLFTAIFLIRIISNDDEMEKLVNMIMNRKIGMNINFNDFLKNSEKRRSPTSNTDLIDQLFQVDPKMPEKIKNLPNPPQNLQNFQIVVGILSANSNFLQRNSSRNTWLNTKTVNRNPHSQPPNQPYFTYKFLIDRPDRQTLIEDNIFNDIVFLNSSYSGKAVRLGEKLVIWFNYAAVNFPQASLIGKVDDDVWICPQQLYGYLQRLDLVNPKSIQLATDQVQFKHPSYIKNLYFGHVHNLDKSSTPNRQTRIDEMFVLLGWNLVRNLITRPYCFQGEDCPADQFLIDTNFGGSSLGRWLGWFNQKDHQRETRVYGANMHAANKIFAHTLSQQYWNMRDYDNFLNYSDDVVRRGFCRTYYLWHKASINDQKFLYDQYVKMYL